MPSSKFHLSLIDAKSVKLDKNGVPTAIRVFKVGSNLDVRGLDVTYDPKDAKKLLASNNRTDGLVPFDIAHGATNPNAPPESHEAVCWGKLIANETGVWLVNLEWSKEFYSKMVDRRFRYISPTFLVDQEQLKRTKGKRAKVVDLMTVSLTNIPATSDISPIVNSLACRSLLDLSQVGNPEEGLLTRMATKTATNADDLIKREDEDEDEGKDQPEAHKEPDGDEGPMVRDDEEDADDADGDDGDDKDLSDIDIDSLSEAEAKKLCMELMDKLADMKMSMRKREEEDEEDEEGEKRSVVNGLHADRLIDYRDKKGLLGLSLKQLLVKERELRREPKVSRERARESGRLAQREVRQPGDKNAIVSAMNKSARSLGATDDDISAFMRERGTDPQVAERLGLNEPVQGKVWGLTVPNRTKKAS